MVSKKKMKGAREVQQEAFDGTEKVGLVEESYPSK